MQIIINLKMPLTAEIGALSYVYLLPMPINWTI